MRILTLVFMTLSLSSCGAFDRMWTNISGNLTYKCSKSGVEYVQADSGLAVHLDRSGNPVKCIN